MIFEAAGTGAEIQDPRGSIFNSDSLLKSDDFGGVLEHLWGGPHGGGENHDLYEKMMKIMKIIAFYMKIDDFEEKMKKIFGFI